MKHYNVEMKENNSISKLLKQIVPSSRVLEFGCANGQMTKYMSEELKCSVCIVEYDKESFNIAMKYAVDGICSDIMNFEWLTAFHNKFDYVIFADVLEHLSNPGKVIKRCKDVLNDEGSLLVSVPNIGHNDILIKLINQKFEYTDIGLLDNTHIHFFAYDGINNFFEKEGFLIKQLDCTFIETGCTEQFNRGMLPIETSKSILNKLQERESGEVYQFIVCAQKKDFANQKSEFESVISKPYKEGKIYIDRGNGFTEDEVQYVNAINVGEGKYRCESTISNLNNIRALRYDPIEGQNCIITNCNIEQKGKKLRVEYSSNLAGNTGTILLAPDPMVVVRTDDDKNEIALQIEYIVESDTFTEEVLHNFQDKQNDFLKSNYEADVYKIEKEKELENYKTEKERELENYKAEKEKELENYKTEKEEELENYKTEKEKELENYRTEKERELEECKKEKELLLSDFRAVSDMKDRQIRINHKELLEQKEILDTIKRELLEQKEISDTVKRELLEQKEISDTVKKELLEQQEISDIVKRELLEQKEISDTTKRELLEEKEKSSALEARINKMESTMSWKVTKGLRNMGKILRIK